jgi:hypothetical protein
MDKGITAVRRIQKFQVGGGAENELARRNIPQTEAQKALGRQMDVEYEMYLSDYMGPYRAETIDASRHKPLLTDPYTVRGFYSLPGSSEAQKRESEERLGYDKIFQEAGMEVSDPDMVYTVAAREANLQILGHEFGHRGDYMQGLFPPTGAREAILTTLSSIPPREQYEETFNILFDAWRANTPERWKDAVGSWGYTQNRFFQTTGGEQGHDYSAGSVGSSGWTQATANKASADLAQLLDLNRENLLILEADAMEQQNRRRLATFEERGLPYTPDTPEKMAKDRARNLENLGNSADYRARITGRAPSLRDTNPVERAYGGGVYG